MEHPKPLQGPTGPILLSPEQFKQKAAEKAQRDKARALEFSKAPSNWDDQPRVFRAGMIPAPDKMPTEHTTAMVTLIYNILKGLILIKHVNVSKFEAGMKEIKQLNPGLYERVRTYYDRLTPKQIAFFIGPRPAYHDDGALAIYDHKRDNPVLQEVIKGEKPEDVKPGSLAPISKLALPRRLGGIL